MFRENPTKSQASIPAGGLVSTILGRTMDKLNLPILLGTNRQLRKSVFVAKWLMGEIEKRTDINTRLFDVADFALPHNDYGQEIKSQFPEWRDAIVQADGLIIVSPEYNHGYPGALKAVLDLLLREYIHKSVAFVGVSAGPWGGTRVIEALVPMVRELGLAVTFTDLNFPFVQKTFNERGEILDSAFEKRGKDFLDELVWMSRVLKWGRQNLPSKYHTA
jgi:NAD(P)H-dependent FMN reductase